MNKAFRTFLYLFIICAIGAMAFILYNPTGNKQVETAKKIVTSKVNEKIKAVSGKEAPSPTLEKFTYSSTKDGKIEWSLTSISGTEADGGDLINLEGIDIVFYSTDGSENNLKASSGSFKASDGLVRLDGTVVLTTKEGLRMEAESLDYNVKKRIITSDSVVSLHGTRFDIRGTGLVMDIDSGEFELKNNVTGGFMYDFL